MIKLPQVHNTFQKQNTKLCFTCSQTVQGRCWRSQWNLRHPAKPFGPEFQPVVHLGQFHSLINWSIDDLFICETKAFKLDLTILLVHGEPTEHQSETTTENF